MENFIKIENFSKILPYLEMFKEGLIITILLAFFTVLLAILPAVGLALMRLSKSKALNFIASAFIEIIRGTPMLVQISIIYYGLFGGVRLPNTEIFGVVQFSMFLPCIIALAINSSAYVAEVFRAGILAVDRGQT